VKSHKEITWDDIQFPPINLWVVADVLFFYYPELYHTITETPTEYEPNDKEVYNE
jgi:hypothetical protein